MFFERTFAIVVPAFPVTHGMVVFIIEVRLDFLVAKKGRPLSVFKTFLVMSEQGHVAKTSPTLEVAMRHAVFVRDLQFLDSVGIPFVPF